MDMKIDLFKNNKKQQLFADKQIPTQEPIDFYINLL